MFESLKKQTEKKLQKKINEEEKSFAAENRKNGEAVSAALNSAASKKGIKDAKIAFFFSEKSQEMAEKIRDSKTTGHCNLLKIDTVLKKVAEEYGNAIKYGDVEAAKGLGKQIDEIIDERAKIADCQRENAEIEAAKVENRASGAYLLAQNYSALRILNQNIKELQRAYNDSAAKYDKQRDATKQAQQQNPQAAAMLKSLVPGQTKLTPAAAALQQAINKTVSLLGQREKAKIIMDAETEKTDVRNDLISYIKLILSQKDSKLSNEALIQMNETMAQYVTMLSAGKAQNKQLEAMMKEYDAKIIAVAKDIDNDYKGIENQRKFDEIMKMEEQEAEGRRIAQQNMAEHTSERRILNEN